MISKRREKSKGDLKVKDLLATQSKLMRIVLYLLPYHATNIMLKIKDMQIKIP